MPITSNYGGPILEQHFAGRNAVVRYHEGGTLFPVSAGVVSAGQATTWLSASHQTQEIYGDVSFNEDFEFVDVTPRAWGGKLMGARRPVASLVAITFRVLHYDSGPPAIWDGAVPLSRFPRLICQKAASRSQIALAFLDEPEVDSTDVTGWLGNFWVRASKAEPIRGLQQWEIHLTPSTYIKWWDTVDII